MSQNKQLLCATNWHWPLSIFLSNLPFSSPTPLFPSPSRQNSKNAQNQKERMHSSARLLHNNLPPKPLPINVAQNPLCNFAYPRKPIILRRDLTFSSLLLFMIGPHTHESLRAETTSTVPDKDKIPQEKAFLDVSINGEPIGRIIIELYNDTVPVGSERFSILVSGAAGISYRRKEFVKIMPNYIQNSGLRSYGVDADIARKTGSNFSVGVTLADELDKQNENSYKGTKNVARSVSIILRDPLKPSPKLKLIARKGKLEIDEEQVGKDPNGTEFVIITKDSPELDSIALVVGRVIEGMGVVERISGVKTVQENTSSPYFRVAKLIGDKRAVVAERGFNRPYSKVVITNCGLVKDI